MELNIDPNKYTRRRFEAEDRVRKLVSNIPEEHIDDFLMLMENNLKNAGSELSVGDIIREMKK